MKHIEKKLSKKSKLIIILSSIFVLMLTASIILGVIVANKKDEVTKNPPPEIIEGEGIKYNMAIAYPEVTDKKMQTIQVKNKGGEYVLSKKSETGGFELYYYDENGELCEYKPRITGEEADFDYNTLFAIEMNDSFKAITKVSYLCLALEAPYFSERIPLAEDGTPERENQLKAYGFTSENTQKIAFSYLDENGATQYHSITIGYTTINEGSYYFMVDGRPYVYVSSNDYFKYGLMGFASLVKASLVTEGISSDKGFGPYLTSNYEQWENEVHKGPSAKPEDAQLPSDTVKEGSTVIVYADTLIVPHTKEEEKVDEDKDGYLSSGYTSIELDLGVDDETYKSMLGALVGKPVGERDGIFYIPGDASQDPKNQIIFSLATQSLDISFGEAESLSYEYTITAIESILTDGAEIVELGTPIGESSKIRVSYTVKINGESKFDNVSHAIIDLTDPLFAEAKERLAGAAVGTLDTPVTFTVVYTKENARVQTGDAVVTEIISIYDKTGKKIDKVTEECTVSFRYRLKVNDEYQEGEWIFMQTLSKDNAESAAVAKALVGKGVSKGLEISIGKKTGYYEKIYDFITYKVARIDAYVTEELVVAFRFQNASRRDPYYGESLYENRTDGYKALYGLNSTSCEGVVRVLGGISKDAASGAANGLFGDEVVEIGVTPDRLLKYGLYAYKINFVLPRGIDAYDSTGGEAETSDEVSDFFSYGELEFTLYVSKPLVDGRRYVASDMYDIITIVDGDQFEFLSYDFESFWIRKNLVLTDIANVDDVEIEFFMDDLKGSYEINLIHTPTYSNGRDKYYSKPTETGYSLFDEITAVVKPKGECTPNKLTELLAAKKAAGKAEEYVTLTELYDKLYYADDVEEYKRVFPDFIGTAYFKDAMRALYLTPYTGIVYDEEDVSLTRDNLVMKMSIKLDSTGNIPQLYRYVYEFYRVDDRRVVVKMYKVERQLDEKTGEPIRDENGNYVDKVIGESANKTYISTFAMKKLANCFFGVFNAEKIDLNAPYPDDKVIE